MTDAIKMKCAHCGELTDTRKLADTGKLTDTGKIYPNKNDNWVVAICAPCLEAFREALDNQIAWLNLTDLDKAGTDDIPQ